MTKPRPIIDIRYYGGRTERGMPQNVPSAPLKLLEDATWVGDRLCRKLRQYELSLGPTDHVYISLAEKSGPTEIVLVPPPRFFFQRVFYSSVDVAIDPRPIAEMSAEQREDLLADLTCDGIRRICTSRLVGTVIDRARADLARDRYALGVEYLRHETVKYAITVSHYLTPMKQGTLRPVRPAHRYFAVVELLDKATGFRGRKHLFDFVSYDDLHAACGSAVLRGDEIVVSARRGHDHGSIMVVRRSDLEPIDHGATR